jgi:hypothetical protein
VALTKDDIDAVAINLLVDGVHTFQVYLTRGGLTQRKGSSDRVDADPVLVKAATDYFEPFLAAVPDALLQAESASMEDGGRDGPRHEWRFEFGGGLSSLVYDITYHAGSAGLPDEFADMVVQAERLTHAWYLAGVAEETGVEARPAGVPVAPPPPKPKAAATRGGTAPKRPAANRATSGTARPIGPSLPATRERIALAVLLDFFALGIPYAYVSALLPDGGAGGPPGAGLVLFAIVEFVLLMVVRRSPGYWLLGISAPPGAKPQVDARWPTRESRITMAVGVALCWSGASGMTGWLLYQTPVPYFGLELGRFLSIVLTMLFAIGSIAGGVLILRTDLRGVWAGAGVMALTLLTVALAWSQWDAWVAAEVEARAVLRGRPLREGELAFAQAFLRVLLVGAPLAILAGVGLTWKRFEGGRRARAVVPQTAR